MQTMQIRTTQGNDVRYQLLNLPYYLVWKLADPLLIP